MQPPTSAHSTVKPKRKPRLGTSCTECRKRKQKCIFPSPSSLDDRSSPSSSVVGSCTNCARRFPPVACVLVRHEAAATDGPTERGIEAGTLTWQLDGYGGRDDEADEGAGARGFARSAGARTASPTTTGEARRSTTTTASRSGGFVAWRAAQQHAGRRTATSRGEIEWFSDGDGDDTDAEATPDSASRHTRRLKHPPIDGSGRAADTVPLFGSILDEINASGGGFPIEQTSRNVELFQYFLRFVAPNLVSIDGDNMPTLFLREMLPWMLQSPLFPNVALLMASTTQTLERGVDAEQSPESLAMRVRVLKYVNEFLRQDFGAIAGEAVKIVINLAITEWFWGAEAAMWAHLGGVRDMVRVYGGMAAMARDEPMIASVLILTDYEVACCYERRNLFLQDSAFPVPIPCPTTYPTPLSSPLAAASTKGDDDERPTTFAGLAEELDLPQAAARTLDDVRFLTMSVLALAAPNSPGRPAEASSSASNSPPPPDDHDGDIGPDDDHDDHVAVEKVYATAAWLHGRLRDEATSNEAAAAVDDELATSSYRHDMAAAIHLAALIYTAAVRDREPLSTACRRLDRAADAAALPSPPPPPSSSSGLPTGGPRGGAAANSATTTTTVPAHHQKRPRSSEMLYSRIRAVPLSRWRRVPGVFLWVVLVGCACACACAGSDPAATRRKTAAAAAAGSGSATATVESRGRAARARFLRRKMAVAGMTIAMDDFGMGIGQLGGMWRIMRWLAGGGGGGGAEEEQATREAGEGGKAAKVKPAGAGVAGDARAGRVAR